jgi:hypothetical protein
VLNKINQTGGRCPHGARSLAGGARLNASPNSFMWSYRVMGAVQKGLCVPSICTLGTEYGGKKIAGKEIRTEGTKLHGPQ